MTAAIFKRLFTKNAVVKIKYVCYTDIINDMQKINCKRKILCV